VQALGVARNWIGATRQGCRECFRGFGRLMSYMFFYFLKKINFLKSKITAEKNLINFKKLPALVYFRLYGLCIIPLRL